MFDFGKHHLLPLIICISGIAVSSCHVKHSAQPTEVPAVEYSMLENSLDSIASKAPGEVGIAVIINSRDTITVNDNDVYPLMSVFKLHQAIALCHYFDINNIPIDTTVIVNRNELNHDTWSPMLNDYSEPEFSMPAREMMRYALSQSDNNASNLMFDRLVGVAETDSFISTIVPRCGFRIAVSENDMHRDHTLSYANHSSPLSAAILINKLFTDSILTYDSQEFIRKSLQNCNTGIDRISAPLSNVDGIIIAHKTGSGYRNDKDELIAHNDVAHIILPDGNHYSIAVFVKDFTGDEKQASYVISSISSAVYKTIASH